MGKKLSVGDVDQNSRHLAIGVSIQSELDTAPRARMGPAPHRDASSVSSEYILMLTTAVRSCQWSTAMKLVDA